MQFLDLRPQISHFQLSFLVQKLGTLSSLHLLIILHAFFLEHGYLLLLDRCRVTLESIFFYSF